MSKGDPAFWRHVATVLFGSLAAQALPLLAAPLITRLCSPQEVGAFGVWFGLIAVLAIAATLRLETAMILDHGPAEQRTGLGVIVMCATAIAVTATLGAALLRAAGVPLLARLSWFGVLSIGAGAWLTALMQTMLAYATSHNAFGRAARARVCGAGGIAVAQVGLLLLGAGPVSLLAGQLVGLVLGLGAAVYLLAPPRPQLALWPSAAQRAYLFKHRAFWRFSLPGNLLNALVGQLPLLLIGVRHGVLAAGLYALTQRVLAAPISLLASSVLEVFKRESVQQFHAQGHCQQAYLHTLRALLLLGSGPALVLLLGAPDLFAWVFGANWRAAGELAQLMAPLFFLNFVVSPLSYVFYVAGKQKVELVWQLVLFAMTVSAFSAPLSLKASVAVYTVGYSLLYLVYLQMSYRFAQGRQAQPATLAPEGPTCQRP